MASPDNKQSHTKQSSLTSKKAILVAGVSIIVVWIISAIYGENKSNTNNSTQLPSSTSSSSQGVTKKISYDVVKQWDIPGTGKLIVISSANLTEEDMMMLGEQLKEETINDRHANIAVFTDRKAAEMRDRVITEELNKEEVAFYEKHYVGNYTKNTSTGYNQFNIWLEGASGSKTKEVKY